MVRRLRENAAKMRREAQTATAEKVRTTLIENANCYEWLAKKTERQQERENGLAD